MGLCGASGCLLTLDNEKWQESGQMIRVLLLKDLVGLSRRVRTWKISLKSGISDESLCNGI